MELADTGTIDGASVSIRKRKKTNEAPCTIPPVEEVDRARADIEKHQHSPDTAAALSPGTYWFTRVVFIRSLAFVYCKCDGEGTIADLEICTLHPLSSTEAFMLAPGSMCLNLMSWAVMSIAFYLFKDVFLPIFMCISVVHFVLQISLVSRKMQVVALGFLLIIV